MADEVDKETFSISDAVRDGLSDDEQRELDHAQAIAQGMVGGMAPDASKYDPKVHGYPLTDDDDDDSEFGDPDGEGVTEVDDTLQDDDIHPYVVTMTFFGASRRTEEDQFIDLLEQVVKDAEGRGLFHFHSSMGVMGMKHVAPGTPLHQAVTGQT